MTALASHLLDHWQSMGLEPALPPERVSCLVKTPRFRASSHVLFFVFADGSEQPLYVAKTPRLPGDHRFLDLEVESLRAVQGVREGGFDSIPRVISYEDLHGTRVLIETALHGRTMSPAVVRAAPAECTRALIAWLVELNRATLEWPRAKTRAERRKIEKPLRHLETVLPEEEKELVSWTRALLQPLYRAALPSVFEHGDLSSPNVLLDDAGRIGVVDWELSQHDGLPGADLFFFLTYIAFAREGAESTPAQEKAFRHAFFGPDAWAPAEIHAYANALGLPSEFLPHLFLLGWTRYVSTLIKRLHDDDATLSSESSALLDWLRSNRYYAIWKHTLEHWDELAL